MQDTGAQAPAEALDEDDTRLAHLGYRPQLNRVLGLFAKLLGGVHLPVADGRHLLPVRLGLGAGGPAYIWLTWIPVAGMLLVALVFGELASHYPVAGALYQYSKYTVGRRFGWFRRLVSTGSRCSSRCGGGYRRGALRHLPGQALARLATRPE